MLEEFIDHRLLIFVGILGHYLAHLLVETEDAFIAAHENHPGIDLGIPWAKAFFLEYDVEVFLVHKLEHRCAKAFEKYDIHIEPTDDRSAIVVDALFDVPHLAADTIDKFGAQKITRPVDSIQRNGGEVDIIGHAGDKIILQQRFMCLGITAENIHLKRGERIRRFAVLAKGFIEKGRSYAFAQ